MSPISALPDRPELRVASPPTLVPSHTRTAAAATVHRGTRAAAVARVHLQVRSVDRSILFWRYVVGLRILDERPGVATLGVLDRPLVVLRSGAATSALPGRTGLDRVTLQVPDERELGRVLARLLASRVPIETSGDGRAPEIRLADPDGLGVAIALGTPAAAAPGGVRVAGGRDPLPDDRPRLDVAALVDLVGDEDLRRSLPDTAVLGAVHLTSGDPAASAAFYARLGLADAAHRPSAAAAAPEGPGAPPAPERSARLVGLAVRPVGPATAVVEEQPGGDTSADGSRPLRDRGPLREDQLLRDPDGIAILVGATGP